MNIGHEILVQCCILIARAQDRVGDKIPTGAKDQDPYHMILLSHSH